MVPTLMTLLLYACSTSSQENTKQVVEAENEPEASQEDTDIVDTQTATETETEVVTETVTETATETVTETETETETEVEPEPQIIRFIVMGDGGEGNDAQYANSDAIEDVCNQKNDSHIGCEFVLYLGDNFYDDGVSSVTDTQFQTKFEDPYSNLTLQFNVVLGNHDYGELSLSKEKGQYEIDYTNYSSKWNLPSEFYTYEQEHALFIGLDTNAIMLEDLTWLGWGGHGQEEWIQNEYAASAAEWRIAYGHHPYISNGRHGNAGEYEGFSWLPIANGEDVEDFMNANICGQVDIYFAGHDHNRQWLEPTCGTEFIVSGAAAKTTDLADRGNPVLFEDDSKPGFLWAEIRDNCFFGEFYDSAGNMDFSHHFCK